MAGTRRRRKQSRSRHFRSAQSPRRFGQLHRDSRTPRYRLDADVRTLSRATASGAASSKALAVLPFSAVGGTEDDKRLAFGMADALITRLSRIKEIAVRPTTSITRYVDATQSPGELGRELRADVVLCGSVRRSAAQVRVTVQLIDVATEAALWADKLTKPRRTSSPSRIRFPSGSPTRWPPSSRTGTTLADTACDAERRSVRPLSARTLLVEPSHGRNDAQGGRMLRARRAARPAIRAGARQHRQAYVLLSIASATIEAAPPREVVPLALAAAQRALAIDDKLSEAMACWDT